MKSFSCHVGVFVLLALAAFGSTVRAAPPTVDPLVGDWLYWKNHPVSFNADGTSDWKGSGHGTWQYLHNPEVQRHYRIVWDQGKSIDTLVLAEDGQRAHVNNQLAPYNQYDVRRTIPDKPITLATASATPMPAAGMVDPRDPVIGDWVWRIGHPAVFRADGTALQNGNLQGVWEYLPGPGPSRKYQVSWEHGKYIETFVCTPDLQSASVVKAGYPPFEVHRVVPDTPAVPAASPAPAVAATDLPAALPADPRDPVIGNWRWKGGNLTVFRVDGTATENKTLQGVWQFLHNPEAGRQYRVVWQHGFEETFVCAADGQTAQGVNKHGVQFDARRLSTDQSAPPASQFGTSIPP